MEKSCAALLLVSTDSVKERWTKVGNSERSTVWTRRSNRNVNFMSYRLLRTVSAHRRSQTKLKKKRESSIFERTNLSLFKTSSEEFPVDGYF